MHQVEEIPRCSFCNKSKGEVGKLIAGRKAFICDECVDACNDIIDDGFAITQKPRLGYGVPAKPPTEIRCAMCRGHKSFDDSVLILHHAVLCGNCVSDVEMALTEKYEHAKDDDGSGHT
jgi:ClpX C4-type zinc finger